MKVEAAAGRPFGFEDQTLHTWLKAREALRKKFDATEVLARLEAEALQWQDQLRRKEVTAAVMKRRVLIQSCEGISCWVCCNS